MYVILTLKSPLKQKAEGSRGSSDRLVVRPSDMRIPSEFHKFLNNNSSKERIFEIIKETLLSHNNTSIDRRFILQEEAPVKYFQEVMLMLHSL